jgi:hypothetical protein
VFFSRADGIGVVHMSGSDPASQNFRFSLNQLPVPQVSDEEEEEEDDDEWHVDELISDISSGAERDRLFYSTIFKKQW